MSKQQSTIAWVAPGGYFHSWVKITPGRAKRKDVTWIFKRFRASDRLVATRLQTESLSSRITTRAHTTKFKGPFTRTRAAQSSSKISGALSIAPQCWTLHDRINARTLQRIPFAPHIFLILLLHITLSLRRDSSHKPMMIYMVYQNQVKYSNIGTEAREWAKKGQNKTQSGVQTQQMLALCSYVCVHTKLFRLKTSVPQNR